MWRCASRVPGVFVPMLMLSVIHGGRCLRHVSVRSPQAVERGADAVLRCLYDLEADSLYSVKWYRGDREFCRYSPREVPPLKVFRLPGIHVDISESDWERLTLRGVTHAAAGRYMCEVSADAPSFHTAQVNTTLAVVDMPSGPPELKGMKTRYQPGSRLHVECVCRDSRPPANLTFFINGDPAPEKHVRSSHAHENRAGLFTASAFLNLIVHPHHFLDGKLKVRCTASIYQLYWRSTEKSSMEEQRRSTEQPEPQRVALVFPVQGQQTQTVPESGVAESGGNAATASWLLMAAGAVATAVRTRILVVAAAACFLQASPLTSTGLCRNMSISTCSHR